MEYPKISINIVTYNRASYLSKAISSVLEQSFQDYELVIVDDGSTDDTESVIKSFVGKDKRIKYIKNETNLKISKARNRALANSKGKYIAVLDSDDCWCDVDKLRKQYEFLESHPDYAAVGGSLIRVNKNGQELSRKINLSTDNDIRIRFLFKNPITHSTVMYRKDLAVELGGYDETLAVGEDYDLMLKMGLKGKICNFKDIFTKYRVHDGSICSTDKLKSLKILYVIKKYKGLYPNYYIAFLKRWIKLFIGKLIFKK